MKKSNQGKSETSRAAEFSTNKRPTTHSDHGRRWWPDLSLEELTENRLRSTDEDALAAEHAVAQQYPGAMFGI